MGWYKIAQSEESSQMAASVTQAQSRVVASIGKTVYDSMIEPLNNLMSEGVLADLESLPPKSAESIVKMLDKNTVAGMRMLAIVAHGELDDVVTLARNFTSNIGNQIDVGDQSQNIENVRLFLTQISSLKSQTRNGIFNGVISNVRELLSGLE